jgi:hypothetical protein
MKIMLSFITVLAILFAALSCSDKASQPGDLPVPGSIVPDSTYVMVTPAWTEADGIPFNRPSDVKIGYDRYIYIADRDNDRVVKLSLAGEFVESYAVRYPTQVAQDRALDLLAISDSSVILRRSYREGGDFEEVFVAPNVYMPYPIEKEVPAAMYGIAASPFPDKTYLISHWHENSIFRFDSADQFKGTQIPPGAGLGKASQPVCVNTFDFSGTYVICYTSGNNYYSAQVVNAQSGDPIIPDSDSADIYGTTMTGHKDITMDRLGNVFVCFRNKENSEVWKFSRYGVLQLKFGQDGGPGDRLSGPSGIDVYQNYVYVADTDNNRIVRFEISTSVQQ